MKKGILGIFAFLLAAGCMTPVQANDGWDPSSTHFTLDAGLAAGGDKLVTVFTTDGKSHTIYAGDALYSDVGVQHNFADSAWSLRGTAGVSVWAESFKTPSNGDVNVSFVYLPVNLLGIYSIGDNHFGAGLAVHVAPKLDLDGLGPNVDFKTAAGLVLQYQYWLFGVRYTAISYSCDQCSRNVNGNSIGLFFNYVF